MITWTLTTASGTNPADCVADVALDRNAAVATAAEVLRHAIMDAARPMNLESEAPAFAITMDGDVVASVHMTRNQLGGLDVDGALDRVEQFERHRSGHEMADPEMGPGMGEVDRGDFA
ncbi:hypothetical protein GCM10007304_46780 [Rhodococcoides trifolii]|uniref:Uncharacterized protein n=1 Tax=Rhodococcoides trifolii TaxID=908250 RepID=A0A917G8D1_9NOCA|nr:hypothetical protein [Rhodococcus trifolii]GGG27594.1 hypothetical protein GCM10007304_46780 [Rhodococcus trifolii]